MASKQTIKLTEEEEAWAENLLFKSDEDPFDAGDDWLILDRYVDSCPMEPVDWAQAAARGVLRSLQFPPNVDDKLAAALFEVKEDRRVEIIEKSSIIIRHAAKELIASERAHSAALLMLLADGDGIFQMKDSGITIKLLGDPSVKIDDLSNQLCKKRVKCLILKP